MNIQINNYNELLEFIKREDVSVKDATEIVCKALRVICVFEKTKNELIKDTEYHINQFCQIDRNEQPIILGQTNLDFDIKEVFKSK
jgi:hypothetical protein